MAVMTPDPKTKRRAMAIINFLLNLGLELPVEVITCSGPGKSVGGLKGV